MAITDRLGVPVGNELRAFDENSTPGSERRQGLFGFGHQLLQPCSRPRAAEHADHRRLAGHRVLAGRFADQGRIAFEIEKIVGDLEGLADRRSIALERVALRLARASREYRPPGRRSATARRSSSPAACGTSFSPSCCGPPPSKRPSAARSSICPPTMPPRPAARASALTSAMRTAGSGCVSLPRQDVEGEASADHRRRESRSLRRISCARSAGRAAGRHCPWPADRRAPANSNARIPAPRRPSEPAGAGPRTAPHIRPPGRAGSACRRRGWNSAWPRSGAPGG